LFSQADEKIKRAMTSTTPQQQDFYFVVDKIDVVPELRVRPRINVSEDLFRGGHR